MSERHAAPQANGYSEAGASITRRALKGFTPESSSPNEDIVRNIDLLRKRSRLLYMSSPVATSAINTNRSKVVGVGLGLKANINRDVLGLTPEAAKAWQKRTEAEFALWANKPRNCDAIGKNGFMDMQQLALKSWLMSGDCFVLMKRKPADKNNPYSLRLHVIEADRVSTPDSFCGGMTAAGFLEGVVPDDKPGAGHAVIDGVEIDDDGLVQAYYVASRYPREYTAKPIQWQRVLAYGENTGLANILHIMDSERPDQYRGVPYLAQIIEPLLQTRRYTESELMAALVQSFFTAWIETETSPLDIPVNEVGPGETNGEEPIDEDSVSDSENEYEMGPGTVLHLKENEKVNFGNPNIPTAGFETFMKTMLRMMGAALEMPYDVLIKEYNSSYSSARAAMQDAWEAFRTRRSWFVDDMCQPVYETWLSEAVALGRIKAPGFFDDPLLRAAWSGARWIGPAQGILDPLKEARAALLLIDHGIKTHAQVTMEMTGGDWEENVEQLAKENEMLAKAGGGTVAAMNTGGGEGGDGE